MKPDERWAAIARLTGHTAAEIQNMFDPNIQRPESRPILAALRDAAAGIREQTLATRMLIDVVDRCAKTVGVVPEVDPFPEVINDAAIKDTFGYHDPDGGNQLPTVEQVAVANAKRKADRAATKAQREAAQTAAPQPPDRAQMMVAESTFRFDFVAAEAAIKADAGKGERVSPEVFASLINGEKPVLVRAAKGAPLLLDKEALYYAKDCAKNSEAAARLIQTAKEAHKAYKGKSADTNVPKSQ